MYIVTPRCLSGCGGSSNYFPLVDVAVARGDGDSTNFDARAELISKSPTSLLIAILKGELGSIGTNALIQPLGMARQPGTHGVVAPFWPPW